MANNRQDARASFTIWAEAEDEANQDAKVPRVDRGITVYMIATGAVITGLIVAVVLIAGGLMRANTVNGGQAEQIRALNQANSRLMTQQSELNSALSGQNPASDTNLVTCTDLRKMGLTVTTGGTVSSVPGTVSLTQNPVRIPAHCAKR